MQENRSPETVLNEKIARCKHQINLILRTRKQFDNAHQRICYHHKTLKWLKGYQNKMDGYQRELDTLRKRQRRTFYFCKVPLPPELKKIILGYI